MVELSIYGRIEYVDLASVSWKLLHDRFSHADRVRVFELQLEMFSLKQGNNSVTDDLNQITSLWEEIDSYRLLPICSCRVQCVCLSSRAGR